MSKPAQGCSSFGLLAVGSVGLFCFVTDSIVPIVGLIGLVPVIIFANRLK